MVPPFSPSSFHRKYFGSHDAPNTDYTDDEREGREKLRNRLKKHPRSSSIPAENRSNQDLTFRRPTTPPGRSIKSPPGPLARRHTTDDTDDQTQTQSILEAARHLWKGRRSHSDPQPKGHRSLTSGSTTSVSTPQITPIIIRQPAADLTGRHKILFYHKHEPYYGFTNFSSHVVMFEGKKYPTSEHLFQSFKFIPDRPGLAEHIRMCSSRPSVAFSEARRFSLEVRSDWGDRNIEAMDIAIYHKFTQHKVLKRQLLETGNAELIENSDKDAFWGCGADGKGKNELGKALERLRDRLRREGR